MAEMALSEASWAAGYAVGLMEGEAYRTALAELVRLKRLKKQADRLHSMGRQEEAKHLYVEYRQGKLSAWDMGFALFPEKEVE